MSSINFKNVNLVYYEPMKTLTRIPHRGVFAGVIAGLADYFATDVTLLHVAFLLFLLVTGLFPGVTVYFIAVLIMPVEQSVIHEQHSSTANQS